MARWFSSLLPSQRRSVQESKRPASARRRLAFEPLEDRLMLTTNWFVIDNMSGEVTITLPDTTANVDIEYVAHGGHNYLAVDGDRFGLDDKTIKTTQVAKITIAGTKTGPDCCHARHLHVAAAVQSEDLHYLRRQRRRRERDQGQRLR